MPKHLTRTDVAADVMAMALTWTPHSPNTSSSSSELEDASSLQWQGPVLGGTPRIDRADQDDLEIDDAPDSQPCSTPSLATIQLDARQQHACLRYMQRRRGDAFDFAAAGVRTSRHHTARPSPPQVPWELFKSRHGVDVFRSTRSRCEVRAETTISASMAHVMSLLAGDTSEHFAHAQRVLLGARHVLDARVLSPCVPLDPATHRHCSIKYTARSNPFRAGSAIDLVLLDLTDSTTTASGQRVGFCLRESVRVSDMERNALYTRAALRCMVYVVRESRRAVAGTVKVTFAANLDPKTAHSALRRHAWLEQTLQRMERLRAFAEQAQLASCLPPRVAMAAPTARCAWCRAAFTMFRKRHACRACARAVCSRCSRGVQVASARERERVCLSCMLDARRQNAREPNDEDASTQANVSTTQAKTLQKQRSMQMRMRGNSDSEGNGNDDESDESGIECGRSGRGRASTQ